MLIRSQDKMSLVKFENIVININNIDGKEIICWSQINPGEDEYISLGHYSTKEKAMKVLDMIQEAYEEACYAKNTVAVLLRTFSEVPKVERDKKILGAIRETFKKTTCFQMPADSEVEA